MRPVLHLGGCKAQRGLLAPLSQVSAAGALMMVNVRKIDWEGAQQVWLIDPDPNTAL